MYYVLRDTKEKKKKLTQNSRKEEAKIFKKREEKKLQHMHITSSTSFKYDKVTRVEIHTFVKKFKVDNSNNREILQVQ